MPGDTCPEVQMAQIPPTTIEGNLKNLRIIHGALTVSIFLYALLLSRIPPQSTQGMDRTVLAALAAIVVGEIGAGFVLRRMFIERAFEALRLKPDDAEALASWRK